MAYRRRIPDAADLAGRPRSRAWLVPVVPVGGRSVLDHRAVIVTGVDLALPLQSTAGAEIGNTQVAGGRSLNWDGGPGGGCEWPHTCSEAQETRRVTP